MNKFFSAKLAESPKLSVLIRVLSVVLALAVVFWIGMVVGYRKAEFSYHFSDRYFRVFGGQNNSRFGIVGMMNTDDLIGGHGTVGKVVSVNLPTIVVSDRNGVEQTVTVKDDTTFRSARSMVASTTVTAGDSVVIIGNPDSNGRIVAKLVRIMPSQILNTSSTTWPVGRGHGMMYTK